MSDTDGPGWAEMDLIARSLPSGITQLREVLASAGTDPDVLQASRLAAELTASLARLTLGVAGQIIEPAPEDGNRPQEGSIE